ncbi:Pentatricopeptide repeat-containing protein, chloroplastic [Symbiodinium microadriaticum]|uniref:Pentatricopeptide repeat-containing protein, chloroplastic n=1 Tax=Symbiodinium microadriaticum TaxID=2951 RepID=A0A1Q9F2U9_SYMMI|nr:Pentatricopeptide repeat-containing protein, chloroplastic [Symbiodinium microadriaticum]
MTWSLTSSSRFTWLALSVLASTSRAYRRVAVWATLALQNDVWCPGQGENAMRDSDAEMRRRGCWSAPFGFVSSAVRKLSMCNMLNIMFHFQFLVQAYPHLEVLRWAKSLISFAVHGRAVLGTRKRAVDGNPRPKLRTYNVGRHLGWTMLSSEGARASVVSSIRRFLHLDPKADVSNKKLVTLHYVVEILARLPTVFLYSIYLRPRYGERPFISLFVVDIALTCALLQWEVHEAVLQASILERRHTSLELTLPGCLYAMLATISDAMNLATLERSVATDAEVSVPMFMVNFVLFDPCFPFYHVNQVYYYIKYLEALFMWTCILEDRRCLTPAPASPSKALTEQRARMSAVEAAAFTIWKEEDMDLEAQIPLVANSGSSEPAPPSRGSHFPMQHISGLENIIEDLRQISKARELEQTDTSILSRSKGPSDFDGGEATLAPVCTRKNAMLGAAHCGEFEACDDIGMLGYLSKHARIRTLRFHSSADGQTIAAWPGPARHPNTTGCMAAYTSRIAALARFPGQWQAALAVLCGMPQSSLQPNVFSFTAAISAMAKCTRWQVAEALFELMQDSLVSSNVVSFNATLHAYARAGKWDLAQRVLESMPYVRVCPDAISISTAISACKRAGNWKAAVGFLASSTALRAPVTTVTCNALLTVCESASQWQTAMVLVRNIGKESLQTDEITHNTAISACGQGGQWPQSVVLFAAAEALKQTSAATYNACMHALQQNSQWHRALTLFGRMDGARIRPDAASFATSISSCHHSAEWQLALHLLNEMSSASVARNSVVCNAALTTCEKAGERKMAFRLLRALPRHGVVADEISYNATISACAKTDRWDMALQVLEEMLMARVLPSEVSITAALAAFEISGEWEQAIQMMDFLLAQAPPPSLVCFNALLGSLSKALQWERSLKLLVDVGGDGITHQTTLAACSAGSKWKLTLCLLREMQDLPLMGESFSVAKELAAAACEASMQRPRAHQAAARDAWPWPAARPGLCDMRRKRQEWGSWLESGISDSAADTFAYLFCVMANTNRLGSGLGSEL